MAKSKPTLLADAEKVIAEAELSFDRIGKALKQIRDGELYKVAEYETFEGYALKRWEMGRQHAYRLIAAHEVLVNLDGMDIKPTNEAQARALAELSADQQIEVWGAVVDKGEKVTARLIRETRDELYSPDSRKLESVMSNLAEFDAKPDDTQMAQLVKLSPSKQKEVWKESVETEKPIEQIVAKPTDKPKFLDELRKEYDRLESDTEELLRSLKRLRKAAELDHELVLEVSRGSTVLVIVKNEVYHLKRYEIVDSEYDIFPVFSDADLVVVLAKLSDEFKSVLPC